MPSAIDIANIALSHIGADATVVSLSPPDGSAEAGHCARFLPIARQAAISSHNWGFAKKRVALAELENTSAEWLYRYQLPADCLRPIKVLTRTDVDEPERTGVLSDVFGSAIYCDQPEAELIYLTDITDTTKYPADFVSALGLLLAAYLAGPIIKGAEGMRVGNILREQAAAAMRQVAVDDSNAGRNNSTFTAASLKARA